MKINGQTPQTPVDLPAVASSQTRPRAGTEATAGQRSGTTTPAAKVELSSRSRELHAALALARQAPDVRSDAVESARERLANGTYQIDPTRIARAMLDKRA